MQYHKRMSLHTVASQYIERYNPTLGEQRVVMMQLITEAPLSQWDMSSAGFDRDVLTICLPIRRMRQITDFEAVLGRQCVPPEMKEWSEVDLPEPFEPLTHTFYIKDYFGHRSNALHLNDTMHRWLKDNLEGKYAWNGLYGYSFDVFEDFALFKLKFS